MRVNTGGGMVFRQCTTTTTMTTTWTKVNNRKTENTHARTTLANTREPQLECTATDYKNKAS